MQEKNHFPEPSRHMLTFLHSIVMCKGHILSIGGDALLGVKSLPLLKSDHKDPFPSTPCDLQMF